MAPRKAYSSARPLVCTPVTRPSAVTPVDGEKKAAPACPLIALPSV
jgi:hypothetical protein